MEKIFKGDELMICNKCREPTEGINALCYQCQLDIINKWLSSPKNKSYLLLLADEYDVRISTIMNILSQFKVL
jgi:hypothetical protein